MFPARPPAVFSSVQPSPSRCPRAARGRRVGSSSTQPHCDHTTLASTSLFNTHREGRQNCRLERRSTVQTPAQVPRNFPAQGEKNGRHGLLLPTAGSSLGSPAGQPSNPGHWHWVNCRRAAFVRFWVAGRSDSWFVLILAFGAKWIINGRQRVRCGRPVASQMHIYGTICNLCIAVRRLSWPTHN